MHSVAPARSSATLHLTAPRLPPAWSLLRGSENALPAVPSRLRRRPPAAGSRNRLHPEALDPPAACRSWRRVAVVAGSDLLVATALRRRNHREVICSAVAAATAFHAGDREQPIQGSTSTSAPAVPITASGDRWVMETSSAPSIRTCGSVAEMREATMSTAYRDPSVPKPCRYSTKAERRKLPHSSWSFSIEKRNACQEGTAWAAPAERSC